MSTASRLALSLVTLACFAAPSALAAEPRQHGDLVIGDPPRVHRTDDTSTWTRDIVGALRRGDRREWVGMPVPSYVAAGVGDLELVRLVPVEGGLLAQYFEPYGTASSPGCAAQDMWENCGWRFRMYRADGEMAWELDAGARFPREDHLAIHGFALEGDTLYYHERCQTYAKDARGRCSNVVAVDVSASPPKELWRSPFLVSNTDVVVVGKWLVTGYGFTAERDYLYVLDRATGKVAQKVSVPKAPERIERVGDDAVDVRIYDDPTPRRYALDPAGKRPALKRR